MLKFIALTLLFCALDAQAASLGLRWQDVVNTTQDGYIVQRRLNTASSPYVEVGRTSKTTTAYIDNDAADSQAYCYQVLAFRVTPEQVSVPSNEACAIALTLLVAPVNLTITQPAK